MISENSIALIRDNFLSHVSGQPKPTIYATCGIPGAGKSTFVDTKISDGLFPNNAYILNPDRVMLALSEYINHPHKQIAYQNLELPARELAYHLAYEVIENRGTIIKDMGCANPLSLELIQFAKNAGYRIEMFYIECSIEEAFKRISQRDFQISQIEVRNRLLQLEKLIPEYQSIADSFKIYDNSDLKNPFILKT